MNFLVSGLTFTALIHFEFIFVYHVRKFSTFILWHVAAQFFYHHSLKRLSFPHYTFLPSFSKVIHRFMGLCLELLSCTIVLYLCFCSHTILSWWLLLCVIVWSQEGWFLHLHSFSRMFCLFGVFCVSIWIVRFLFYFYEKYH